MNKTYSLAKRREEMISLKASLRVSKSINIIFFVMICILSLKYMDTVNSAQERYDVLANNYNVLESNYSILVEKYDSFNTTIDELLEICSTIDSQNKELAESNDKYYEELQVFYEREELFDKYEYAIYDRANNRTDITYDQLLTLEKLVEDSKICNEDLILSIVMTESVGREKAKSTESTAKGYGQILDGTSKFVYTKLLGNSSSDWNSSIALDGYTNLQMMVAYIDWLYATNNNNLFAAIRGYRGKQDITKYVASIDSYLAKSTNENKSVKALASR